MKRVCWRRMVCRKPWLKPCFSCFCFGDAIFTSWISTFFIDNVQTSVDTNDETMYTMQIITECWIGDMVFW